MIHEALKFLAAQLNEYLIAKLDPETEEDFVIRKRLVTSTGNEINDRNKVVCQLVNVEEERTGKAQMPLAPPIGSGFPMRNPELKLNLCVMFTAISPDDNNVNVEDDYEYEMSLKMLSYVIQFFQYRHYFTTENSPALPASIGTLIMELYPISLESQNYLWASLGAKYRPSVVYKARLITIFEDTFSDVVGVPRILTHNTNPQPEN
jgi:hypothetical protein